MLDHHDRRSEHREAGESDHSEAFEHSALVLGLPILDEGRQRERR